MTRSIVELTSLEAMQAHRGDVLELALDGRSGMERFLKSCHNASAMAGWWHDLESGEPIPVTQALVGDKLMLVVTEIAEAKEGYRKGLMDDHLHHRKMIEVELADALIRIGDLAGRLNLDVAGAAVEKLAYNAHREDHKRDSRMADGGKKS